MFDFVLRAAARRADGPAAARADARSSARSARRTDAPDHAPDEGQLRHAPVVGFMFHPPGTVRLVTPAEAAAARGDRAERGP